MIKERQDIEFLILTKRIDRFMVSLPEDWGEGYDNVNLGCTVETQEIADYRLPLFLSYPIKRRFIACGPMLEKIDLSNYLHGVEHVTVGGETGRDARMCDYDWVLDIRRQCKEAGKTFWFKETGSLFRNIPTATYELPYEGAKEMLLVDEVDDKEFITGLFNAVYEELPAPKPKKK